MEGRNRIRLCEGYGQTETVSMKFVLFIFFITIDIYVIIIYHNSKRIYTNQTLTDLLYQASVEEYRFQVYSFYQDITSNYPYFDENCTLTYTHVAGNSNLGFIIEHFM